MHDVKINKDFPFLHKRGITSAIIIPVNGLYVLTTSDGFKQSLKQSEYAQIMKSIITVEEIKPVSVIDDPADNPKSFDVETRRAELNEMGKSSIKQIALQYSDIKGYVSKSNLIEIIINAEAKANAPIN